MNTLPTASSTEGGWISGGMADEPRPEYNPVRLVNHVVNILRAEGLSMPTYRGTEFDDPGLAAADLLRALNLSPSTDH